MQKISDLLQAIKEALNTPRAPANPGGTGGGSDGSGDASGDCPYGASDIRCSDEDPWKPFIPDEVEGPRTVEDVYNAFKSELANGPLGPVFNHQPQGETQGECPEFTIPSSKYWQSQVVTAHCYVFDKAKPVIRTVMTWAWAFIGLFILLK